MAAHARGAKTTLVGLAVTVILAGVSFVAADRAQAEEPSGPFAIESFSTSVSTTQAGGHPDVGVSIRFATHIDEEGVHRPNADPRDLTVNASSGLVGDLTAGVDCSETVFQHSSGVGCPDASQVGAATEFFAGTGVANYPVVLLPPGSDRLGRLGIGGPVPVVIDVSLRTGTDYGITTSTVDIEPAKVWGVDLQLWGIPGQHYRGCQSFEFVPFTTCVSHTPPAPPSQWRPFLTNPTTCSIGPLTSTLSVNSYQDPAQFITAEATQSPATGCAALAFDPSVTMIPDHAQADAPSGYSFDLAVPQNADPNGFASSELRNAVVTLPPGVTLDPSVATGLQACSDEQFGKSNTSPPSW
jgi:hypothetical protein